MIYRGIFQTTLDGQSGSNLCIEVSGMLLCFKSESVQDRGDLCLGSKWTGTSKSMMVSPYMFIPCSTLDISNSHSGVSLEPAQVVLNAKVPKGPRGTRPCPTSAEF